MQLEEIWQKADDFRFLKYNLWLSHLLQDESETLFLTYILYWQSSKTKWVYKSKRTIKEELDFKPDKQRRVIKALKIKKLLEVEARKEYAMVNHFRVNYVELIKQLDGGGFWRNKKSILLKKRWDKQKGLD